MLFTATRIPKRRLKIELSPVPASEASGGSEDERSEVFRWFKSGRRHFPVNS